MQRIATPNRTVARLERAHVPRLRVRHAAHGRGDRLRDDGESGAQVVEYALLAGVAVAVCTALIVAVRAGLLDALLSALMQLLVGAIQSWAG